MVQIWSVDYFLIIAQPQIVIQKVITWLIHLIVGRKNESELSEL